MNVEEFRDFCLSLGPVEERMPFDDRALVFYVKNKMFALTDIESFDRINIKCGPEEAVLLREQYEAVVPGYHMNKIHWNSIIMDGSLPDKLVKEWIENSYRLVIAGLPKKIQKELGF